VSILAIDEVERLTWRFSSEQPGSIPANAQIKTRLVFYFSSPAV